MSRLPSWGTPDRTKHYVVPRKTGGYVAVGLLAGGAVLAVLTLLRGTGVETPLSAGPVISAHASIEAKCEQCHSLGGGVSNLRCQRCHDPAGGSTLSTTAHAIYISGDVERVSSVTELGCAHCHVEHRGRDHALDRIDETYCGGCHFRSFSAHPEFEILRTGEPDGGRLPEMTGLAQFSHVGHFDAIERKRNIGREASCFECHEYDGNDFTPLSFERTCGTESCHVITENQTEALPLEDVLSPSAIRALAIPGDWVFRDDEFLIEFGTITKTTLRHRDDWILFNVAWMESRRDPLGYMRSRDELVAELGRLRRRQALATPLAGLDEARLRAREASLQTELEALDARLAALGSAVAPGSGASLVDRALAVLAGGNRTRDVAAEAREIRSDLAAVSSADAPDGGLSREELDARRDELYDLLDYLTERASDDPEVQSDIEGLRARLAALVPGFSSRSLLERSREQRAFDLERVRDELSLRAEGVAPAANTLLLSQQRRLQRRAEGTLARLARLPEWPPPAPPLDDDAQQAIGDTLTELTITCSNACHLPLSANVVTSVATPKLLRSTFVHEPHLLQSDGDCLRCHPTIVESTTPAELNFEGIASCMECHGAGEVDDDCQSCHFYHPSSREW